MTVPAKPIRKSVPTVGIERWWACGWAYVMPDFDTPNHSIVEWLTTSEPADPDAENLAAAVVNEMARTA